MYLTLSVKGVGVLNPLGILYANIYYINPMLLSELKNLTFLIHDKVSENPNILGGIFKMILGDLECADRKCPPPLLGCI